MRVDLRLEADGSAAWQLSASYTIGDDDDPVTLASCGVPRLDESPWVAPPGAAPEGIDDLRDVVDRIHSQGEIEDRDGERLGRYLYESLFARIWPQVADAASAAGDRLVEFALHFPDAPALHGVPWELAHDGICFLTTSKDVVVAVTRRIDSPAKIRQISAPARVLFAIGTDLMDKGVRAGAEFMSLMRELERQDTSIVPLIVDEASADDLSEAVDRFKPDVVHIISHGQADEGKGTLLMRPSEGDDDQSFAPVDGKMLLSALGSSTGLPRIVVLSACDGGAARSSLSVPLALELVAGGVPAVIAMSGRVSDPACRLFTRRFGSVLVQGAPLVRASADGRWAAFRGGEPPSESVDWALPVLFLADSVPHSYKPVKAGAGTKLKRRMENYELPDRPVFCGRRKFLRVYDDLLATGHRPTLSTVVIYTVGESTGVGKTRLLREFAAQALRDGHVPCLLPVKGAPNGERPTTLYDFAEHLLWCIVDARQRCGLEPVASSMLLELLAPDGEQPDLSQHPEDERAHRLTLLLARYRDGAENSAIDASMIRSAAAIDFQRLRAAALASHDPAYTDATRVLLLLDGVDRWDKLPEYLFDSILVGREGFGTPGDCPVPVVVTCAREVLHGELLAELDEAARTRAHLRFMKLQPFEEGDEDTLAFQWVLLNPDPLVSRVVYAAGDPDTNWQKPFRIITDGKPLMLGTRKFFDIAEYLESEGKLKAGDDEERLETHLQMTASSRPSGGRK